MWFLNPAARKIEAMRLDLKYASHFRSRWALTGRMGTNINGQDDFILHGCFSEKKHVKTSNEERESLLNIKQITESLGVCRRTLEREISRGRFPRPGKIGSASRWRASALAEYIALIMNEREPTPPVP